ncbi:LacI family DNA-binding transcriptional regulator [Virgibacillus ndiopensis]|uniref:LacI family DNA-binding transcriptional regulator n=1 Tax=Virgibacillus ndiopensis TaxID=2004408 RepID=UPI000C086CB5|nr:LacI family DNA-binding transcriptional regulator [Virgibacillus ndiopensis]
MKLNNVTMKDIAEYTGVSTATVSRVLNNNYPVNIDTKKKVLDAIKELDYEPNLVARNLRSRKSNLVAIMVADIKNPYYISIANEIDYYLFKEGYNLIICSTNESIEKEQETIRMLLGKNIDAIAISPCDSKNTDLTTLINQNVPIVLIDRKIHGKDIPFVGSNNFEETYLLTEFLIKKGHERIGILNGTLNNSTGQDRFNGFKQAMKDYKLMFNEKWVFSGGFEEKKAYDELNHYLKTKNELPTALLSCNNMMTIGAMTALTENGKNIPDDISLVSFGALANQHLLSPQVACLDQDTTYIGKKVAELILNQLNNTNDQERVLIDSIFMDGNSVKEMK